MRKILLTMFCIVAATFGYQSAFAQGVTTATISGSVTDNTGAALPGATVVAIHTPSGTQYGVATLTNGNFTLQGLRTGGPYKITVSFIGFQDQVKENIFLSLGQNFSLAVSLKETGIELTEITVTAQSDGIINSDRTGASTNISNEQIKALPTLNRSLSDYTRLTPQSGGNDSFGGRNNRFNNFTIDGSIFNNAFGLNSSIGGQSGANAISLDAIDQVQVNLAPFDVRQGQFTGASINAITRSGTNDFSGSVYYFLRNQDFTGKKVARTEVVAADFKRDQYGFRVGGPIIKDKLFFFVNGEATRQTAPGTTLVANAPGRSGSNVVSTISAAELTRLRDFLIDTYNYDPGQFEGYNDETYSNNFTARLDWNINNNHKFNIRYNYLKSYDDIQPSSSGSQGNRGPSTTSLPFSGAWYRINNNMNSVVGELNSRFGNNMSNNFIIGYTALRDFRESTSGEFPLVDIENGNNQNITSFGFEVFSPNNVLDTDIFQISDNFTYFLGKHTITAGFAAELYETRNGFMPSFFGRYRFNTLADFYASAEGGVSNATQYELRYSALPGVEVPIVTLKANIFSLYLQDEYSVAKNLKITGGVRLDLPTFDDGVLPRNETLETLTFRDNQKVDVAKFADDRILWSPRLGFNWDVFGNKKLQIRGGTGIFTGRVPLVWISNQASNNGVVFGSELVNNPTNRPFVSTVNPTWRPSPETASASSTFNIAVTDQNFKYPQVWRSNVAADYKLPNDWTVTAEFIYGKDINAVYYQNLNLPAPTANFTGADNRPRYTVNRIYSNITDVIMLRNSKEGYQFSFTAQVQKSWADGFFASLAYNSADGRDQSSLVGASIAASAYRDNPIVSDPNNPEVSFSGFLLQHRVIGSIGYAKEYAKYFKTSISMFFEGRQGNRSSYTVGGDLNGDGFTNDLMFVPARREDIVLIPAGGANASQPADNRTADLIWAQLDAYIAQDPYLSKRRGRYAERFGLVAPWVNTIDMRILQDFYINVGGKRNTLQLSLDIFNFANLINSEWGVEKIANRTQLISFSGSFDPEGRPRYTFPYINPSNQTPLTTTFRNSTAVSSRWQMQFGIRYIFN